MHPAPEPTESDRQIRKLRLEIRRLRHTAIFCTVAICLTLGIGFTAGFPVVLIIFGFIFTIGVLLFCIAGSARLAADSWDAVSMRWQRARWQAERNKATEKE